MKTSRSVLLIAAVVALGASSGFAAPAKTEKDRTKYDCREIVGWRMVKVGRANVSARRPIYACPHKELMAAGKCETHWLFGMRCKE